MINFAPEDESKYAAPSWVEVLDAREETITERDSVSRLVPVELRSASPHCTSEIRAS